MARRYEKMLEAATDQTLVEPNWESILECVDMIRGNEIPVKEALKMIQKRYRSPNPHVAHHALLVLEACVKNCGKKFHLEIATKDFMDDLKGLIIAGSPENVKQKVLELIQCWSSAFRNSPEYAIVCDTHNLLKMNGFEFPAIDEAKAMFLSDSAPDWAEGDNCYRCRTEFGVFTRKHHCRACGQIFCDKCSNKQMLLPQFGIEKKVRVCESCFDKNLSSAAKTPKSLTKDSVDKAAPDSDAAAAAERARKEAEEKEEEELLLAIALSQSEAEAKEQEKQRKVYQQYNGGGNSDASARQTVASASSYQPKLYSSALNSNPTVEELNATQMENEEQEPPVDSMLAKYLDRDYWERKRRGEEEAGQQLFKATAPPPSEVSLSVSSSVSQRLPNEPVAANGGVNGYDINSNPPTPTTIVNQHFPDPVNNNFAFATPALMTKGDTQKQSQTVFGRITPIAVADASDEGRVAETQKFCNALKERVDIMSMRMRSNQLRGRSIVNDSSIHSLFSQLTDLHGNVLERMTKLENERTYYEGLQDHLAHIQEARQAVNALREEHERQRQEQLREEQNRRQAQLQMKLEFMRHKKHEMLLNERHAALQRFQEHEQQIRLQGLQQQQQMLPGRQLQQQMMPSGVHAQPTTAYQQQQPYQQNLPIQQQSYIQSPQQYVQQPAHHQMYIPQHQQPLPFDQPQHPPHQMTSPQHPAHQMTVSPSPLQHQQPTAAYQQPYVQSMTNMMPVAPQPLHPAQIPMTASLPQQTPPQAQPSYTAVPEDLLISFD